MSSFVLLLGGSNPPADVSVRVNVSLKRFFEQEAAEVTEKKPMAYCDFSANSVISCSKPFRLFGRGIWQSFHRDAHFANSKCQP